MWNRFFLSSHLRRGVSSIASIKRNENLVPYGMGFGGIVDFGHWGTPAPAGSALSVLRRTFSDSSPSKSAADAAHFSGTLPTRNSCTEGDPLTVTEAKRLMRLVNVEGLKTKLGMEGKEIIGYKELLEACQSMGVARTIDEATTFAQVLDEAGVVLLFRDKVYLHPDKVVDLVRKAMPIALTPDDDPTRNELKLLQEKKEEIDVLAHKQVRRILWTGLGLSIFQVSLFFRLTFWEFSWDVMEPIAFFTTATGIVIGYGYFLITSRDPTYQDLMKRLFIRSQKKLFVKHKFDVPRFVELQTKCRSPMDARASIKNRVGKELDLEDSLVRNQKSEFFSV